MPNPVSSGPANSVQQYIDQLPPDRQAAIKTLREVFQANLEANFEERIQYGMIGYCVPHSIFPDGYHCDPQQPLPFGGIASQKSHLSLHLIPLYYSPQACDEFAAQWKAAGKKLDMGKACIRIKKIEDVPLEVVAKFLKQQTVASFVNTYQTALAGRAASTSKSKPAAKKKADVKQTPDVKKIPPVKKKASVKKTAAKQTTTKNGAAKKATTKKAALTKSVAKKKATVKKKSGKKSRR